ncbi:N-acetyl-gamma-glutamyl-phosphate reductase [Streptococcus porcorum]|uniref:N-acetyl-gamma-glutamyl-phosphate reductase n=1 Tax=Streptococcus porcorum TaxID=701526 RepID=A0ABV2JD43_9STRE
MKVSVVGVTGYSGLELVKILESHPNADLVSVYATKEVGQELSYIYPHLDEVTALKVEAFDAEKIMSEADLVFFATPSGIAKDYAHYFVEADFPFIDLSGDHRLPAETYQKWYQKTPAKTEVLEQFTYGLSEFTALKCKHHIANPGCYATATELALIPLLKAQVIDLESIIVDAKSGLSGAGKNPTSASHFVHVHDNYVTYKLNQHQHIPEIVQTLQSYEPNLSHIQFSTSLIPVARGIVATLYLKLTADLTENELLEIYQKAYENKPFVRVKSHLPHLHHVIGSNYTDIGLSYNPLTQVLTVVAVLDNLVKGAAGQAVQNMNLMFGFAETAGLLAAPAFI